MSEGGRLLWNDGLSRGPCDEELKAYVTEDLNCLKDANGRPFYSDQRDGW